MFYVLSKLLWPLAQPSNLLLVLLLLAAALVWRGRRLGPPLLALVGLTLVVIGVLPAGQWLLVPLENRFPRPVDLPARIDGVVMLGGAIELEVAAARHTAALNDAAERVTTLIELARRYPSAQLVVAAGGVPISDAAVLAPFFRSQQLPPDRILFDDRSLNTWQNAVFTQVLARPGRGEHWLLVTSASHMPRAVGCFEAVGWPVIAYPVDYRTSGRLEWWVRFDVSRRLLEFDAAVRAWIGLVAYRLTGRTNALLPGPSSGPPRAGWLSWP